METKLAALGNKKELLPLKSLGASIFDCKNLREAEDLIEDLSGRGFGLVVITEDIIGADQGAFLKIIKRFPLTILVLPQTASPAPHQGGYKIKKNFARNTVKRIIKEAVGF